MRLSGTFAFMVCAFSGSAGVADVDTTNYAARIALSMDTWYRVGITRVRENAKHNVRTTLSTTKLVANLRRH